MKKVITSSSSLLSCLIAMVMMLASQSAWAEYVPLTALSGTGGTGGEGFASLVDQKEGTKMGHSYDQNNPDKPAWIVVKAEKAVVPEFYFLVTGSDTGTYTDRNWKAWNIYGGNFASDAEAVRGDVANPGAGGWTLIDERSGETLPQKNMEHVDMMFNSADGTTAYQYFWIEILESVNGGDIWLQMGEWGLAHMVTSRIFSVKFPSRRQALTNLFNTPSLAVTVTTPAVRASPNSSTVTSAPSGVMDLAPSHLVRLLAVLTSS